MKNTIQNIARRVLKRRDETNLMVHETNNSKVNSVSKNEKYKYKFDRISSIEAILRH